MPASTWSRPPPNRLHTRSPCPNAPTSSSSPPLSPSHPPTTSPSAASPRPPAGGAPVPRAPFRRPPQVRQASQATASAILTDPRDSQHQHLEQLPPPPPRPPRRDAHLPGQPREPLRVPLPPQIQPGRQEHRRRDILPGEAVTITQQLTRPRPRALLESGPRACARPPTLHARPRG